MPKFAIYSRAGELKELTADSYSNQDGFFTFYEDPRDPAETPIKFTIAVSEVSTIEKIGPGSESTA